MCGKISTLNSSPAWTFSLGFFPIPTPAGVPVIMTVPEGRVVPWERKLMSLGMLKMRSLYMVSGCGRMCEGVRVSEELVADTEL